MGELLNWNPQVLGRKAHEARGKQIGRSRKAIELAQMKACESGIEIKEKTTGKIGKPRLPGSKGRVRKSCSGRAKCDRGACGISSKKNETDQLYNRGSALLRLCNHCRK